MLSQKMRTKIAKINIPIFTIFKKLDMTNFVLKILSELGLELLPLRLFANLI